MYAKLRGDLPSILVRAHILWLNHFEYQNFLNLFAAENLQQLSILEKPTRMRVFSLKRTRSPVRFKEQNTPPRRVFHISK